MQMWVFMQCQYIMSIRILNLKGSQAHCRYDLIPLFLLSTAGVMTFHGHSFSFSIRSIYILPNTRRATMTAKYW